MAADEKKGQPNKRITEKQRFTYIGFDVFPGKPKDLFKSDAEKNKFVGRVKDKRDKGDLLREDCTLLEERVSMRDKIVMAVACVIIIGSLFVPWYSAYNEIVEETMVKEEPVVAVVDSALVNDSLTVPDSLVGLAEELVLNETVADSATALAAIAGGADDEVAATQSNINAEGEEVLHSYRAKKKIHKEFTTLSGFAGITSLGDVGSKLFSSGIVLMVTVVLFLVYTLLCLGLPLYTLYGLFGMKGNADQVALQLKKMLRFNWIPLIVFVFALFISFFGATYGFDTGSAELSSIGDSYGVGVFLGTLSYGIFISLAAFVLVAAKGVEI